MHRVKETEGINGAIFMEKYDQQEIVIYGTNKRNIVVRRLPFFEEVIRF